MGRLLKPIRLSLHARERARCRGATEDEIRETIRAAPWASAARGRLQCERDFAYNAEWNAVFYRTKRVSPVFVEEHAEIVVVTVYTYYFDQEQPP